jgi:hypothetical protein
MSFIRPELARKLNRWRETLAGLAASALGFVWFSTATGALWLVGTVLMVGGALLAVAGIQRARFRRGGNGPGLVQVLEGQVTYFGPFDGGSVAVEDLVSVELDPDGTPSPTWVVRGTLGETLHIPVDAAGAEALFDVFAGLPGLQTEAMLKNLEARPSERVTVWTRGPVLVH